MKKKISAISIYVFSIFLSLSFGVFFTSINANAATGNCTCQSTGRLESTYGPRNCSECDSYCSLISVSINGEHHLGKSSCTEDGTGAVTCGCAALITSVSEEACSRTGSVSCTFRAFGGVGASCTIDSECHGTGCENGCYCAYGAEDAQAAGSSDLSAYWAEVSVTSSSCAAKLGNGTECDRNGQCGSNYCGPPSGETLGGVCGPQPGTGEGGTTAEPESKVFPTYQINSPIGEVTGPQLIGRIIQAVLGIVGALALAMFVYGGFTWLISGGSPERIKKGKDILIWAVIGLVVIFASYTAVDFILTAFGLS